MRKVTVMVISNVIITISDVITIISDSKVKKNVERKKAEVVSA